MSKKPYVVQEESPNLVIVPVDNIGTIYEPSPKKVKESDTPLPKPPVPGPSLSHANVFVRKTSAKFNSSGRNNDVLIDVCKIQRSPTSWATNYLQSIGGSSTKFDRIYSSPKSTSLLNNSTRSEEKKSILPNTVQIRQHQVNITPKTMEKKASQPKININLIKPTTTKEASKPNPKYYTSTTQTQMGKEPSLPKKYKIPLQSKPNKLAVQAEVDKNPAKLNSASSNNLQDSVRPKIQTQTSSSHDDEIAQTNHVKITTVCVTKNKENDNLNRNKELNQSKNNLIGSQIRNKKENVVKVNNNTQQLLYGNETKTKKIEHIDKCRTKRCELTPTIYKETHLVNNKENSVLKYNKDKNQRKSMNETLRKGYKEPSNSLPTSTKEKTNLTKNEDIIAHVKTLKELYKLKSKHEPTYSTKLQSKKEHIALISSKKAKHSESKNKESQETRRNKSKDKSVINKQSLLPQTSLAKDDKIAKLKKKRVSDKKSDETEYSDIKNKKRKLSSPDTNAAKNNTPKSLNKERLSKSISPIKSVVSRMISGHQFHKGEKLYHKDSGYYNSHCENSSCKKTDYYCQNIEQHLQRDLRTKLKRKISTNDYKKEDYQWSHGKRVDKFATVPNGEPFVPEENLIISFNADDDDDDNNIKKPTKKKSPVKKMARKRSPKDKKCKIIKLEINIVFGHGDDTTDEESTKSENETKTETVENMDLSFLDDFNVDEIAESLNECKDHTTKTNSKEETMVQCNQQDGMVNDIKNIEARSNNDSVILNINGSTYRDISSVENKIENHKDTGDKLTDNESRPYNNETHATYSKQEFCHLPVLDDTDENVKNQIKMDISQNSQNTDVQGLSSELHMERLNSESFTDSDHNSTNASENNSEEVIYARTDNKLHSMTNIECLKMAEIIDSSIHDKMSSSETNVYSDHNDLIDALQDNSNLEINALKSFMASLNNNTDETTQKTQNEMTSTVTESNTTDYNSGIKQFDMGNASANEPNEPRMEILTSIKEDPDIIFINDSDEESEIEIKDKKPERDENAEIQPVTDSLLNKSDEQLEPTDENSESTLILDTTEKDIQQNISADEVIIFGPTAEKSESVLILDTDYDIEDGAKTCDVNDSNRNDSTINISSQGPMKPKKETNPIEIKTDAIAEVQPERQKSLVKNEITNEIQSENIQAETSESKDEKENVPNAAKVASKIKPKSPEQHCSKKLIQKNVLSTTKTTAVNGKNQNVNTKVHDEDINQENSENNENFTDNSEQKVEKSNFLNNNKFIRALESNLNLLMKGTWTVTDVLHTGRFSKIYRCKDSLKQDYAIKSLKKMANGYNLGFQKENMMMELQNGVPENNLNCVRYVTGFLATGLWCFLMEYYPMNLQQAMVKNKRSFHIDDVQILSRQLVSAVTILRNNNIIHSDIKSSHILINSSQTRIKLCGFDQASYSQDSVMLPNTGSVNYRAPELILGYPAGYGIDVWATALVMYEMATNRKLFPGIYNNDILYQQMCTLGPIPMEMLMDSQFRNAHFRGTAFLKIVGSNAKIIVNEIEFNRRINHTLHQAYSSDWTKERHHALRRDDKLKIRAFSELLHSMLAMYPRSRIAIEFVFANPFIYESFDNC